MPILKMEQKLLLQEEITEVLDGDGEPNSIG